MLDSDPTAPPARLDEIARAVDERMLALLDAEKTRWTQVDGDLAPPFAALRDLVAAGGKRLRPACCHWGFVGVGGDPDDPRLVDACGAIELLHTFALIHDDVIDGSASRRGRPAMHTVFAATHEAEGWRSEARRFGEGAAILVGDLCFVYADLLLAGAPRAVLEVFTDLRLEVNVGQFLDVLGTVRGGTTFDSAKRICVYKSGKYTIERPLHLGAALATGQRRADVEAAFSDYGIPLGEAFQLRDDLLGAFGDPAKTGKPVGDDLREGKPTELHALAREWASETDLHLLDEGMGRLDLTPGDVVTLQDVLERTGARAAIEERIDTLLVAALGAISSAPISGAAIEALADLAVYVTARDR